MAVIPIGTKVVILDRQQLVPRCIAGLVCTVTGYEDNPPTVITRLRLKADKDVMFRFPTLFPWEVRQIEEEEYEPIAYHPEDFFTDDSYTCKLCGYHTDSEDDFVEHIVFAHEREARRSNAVSISGSGVEEHWDVDSIALAEEFDAS